MSRLTSLTIAFSITLLFLPYSLFSDGIGAIAVHGVEGRGKDEQTALNNAFRNAIRKAIGSYVVSSTATDGETVDKKVFDNCDAVVSKYEIVEREEQDGKLTIVIDAEIIRNEMMKYIQKTASTEVGEGELANLLAKRNAVNNAVGSLELLFMNWRENVYRVEKYGNLSIAADDDTNADTVHVSIPFIVTFNWQAYEVFLSKVRNILARIAISRTSGEWNLRRSDGWGSDDFMKVLAPFYVKAGIAHMKSNADEVTDIEIENPNDCGIVEICSHIGKERIKYDLFVVPSQVKKTLDRLLTPEATLCFSFTSKGGGTIASRLIAGEVYSCGSDPMWHSDADSFWGITESWNYQVISDKIRLEFPSQGKVWNECRLFHAVVAVPLDAAQRIAGCKISVQNRGEERWGWERSIKSEAMVEAEWRRIDGKPQQKLTPSSSKSISESHAMPVRNNNSQQARATTPKTAPSPVLPSPITLSAKDKSLKNLVDELSNVPPDAASAGKWFKFSGQVESRELRQEMLKATGAALVYAKRSDVYQAKVRPLINDVATFEETFLGKCPTCGGNKTVSTRCAICSGNGACHSPGCRNGGHLVRQIQGTHWEQCRECKGTGRCKRCGGTGKIQSNCQHCKGRGKTINPDSVAEAYRNCVACIEEAFY